MRIAVFASGSGSNFAAIMQALREKRLSGIEVVLLVCDKPGAYVIKRAEEEAVPVFTFRPKEFESKEAYERMIVEKLQELKIDLIVLAGYMRLVGKTLLGAYSEKIINLHPSLLPSFMGKDAIGQALAYGVKVTGVTVHFVDEGMDTGPIIAQRVVYIEDSETRETLTRKIQEQEHALLPEVIGFLAKGQIHPRSRQAVK